MSLHFILSVLKYINLYDKLIRNKLYFCNPVLSLTIIFLIKRTTSLNILFSYQIRTGSYRLYLDLTTETVTRIMSYVMRLFQLPLGLINSTLKVRSVRANRFASLTNSNSLKPCPDHLSVTPGGVLAGGTDRRVVTDRDVLSEHRRRKLKDKTRRDRDNSIIVLPLRVEQLACVRTQHARWISDWWTGPDKVMIRRKNRIEVRSLNIFFTFLLPCFFLTIIFTLHLSDAVFELATHSYQCRSVSFNIDDCMRKS